MAIIIDDPKAEAVVRRLADKRKVSPIDVVLRAVHAEAARDAELGSNPGKPFDVAEVLAWLDRTVGDARMDDHASLYDEHGLPR